MSVLYLLGAYLPVVLLSVPWTVCLLVLSLLQAEELKILTSSIWARFLTLSSLISQGLCFILSVVGFHLIPVVVCYLIIKKCLVYFMYLKVSSFCVLALLKLYILCIVSVSFTFSIYLDLYFV